MKNNKITWDYTPYAEDYLSRPQYAGAVFDDVCDRVNLGPEERIADIGAGTGNCAVQFLERGFVVDAVEPNDAMRRLGIEQTGRFGKSVIWSKATGENTQLPPASYKLVTFGSSFNVLERQLALRETARILQPRGWFMCCWNHRNMNDDLQKAVEQIIVGHLPSYERGIRAQDQTGEIKESGLFGPTEQIVGHVSHIVKTDDWVSAWKSHATLTRQAGDKLAAIMSDIRSLLDGQVKIKIPYVTRGWLAQRNS